MLIPIPVMLVIYTPLPQYYGSKVHHAYLNLSEHVVYLDVNYQKAQYHLCTDNVIIIGT